MGNRKNLIDITGEKFGKWTAIKEVGRDKFNKRCWLVRCDCGNEGVRSLNILKAGDTNSCGKCSKRDVIIKGDTVIIPLTRDQYAIVDLADYQNISELKGDWTAIPREDCGYVALKNIDGNNTLMHRLIMNTPVNQEVDHINHNTLDNRRVNLRNCTNQQNSWNRKKRNDCQSSYKGVFRNYNRWVARINNEIIGTYASEREAAFAYDERAKKLFGDFACPNFSA